MARPINPRKPPATTLDAFSKDMSALIERLSKWVDRPLSAFFAFTQAAAERRLLLLGVFLAVSWLVIALVSHPIEFSLAGIRTGLIQSLFAFDVLRRLLVIAVTFWLTSRWAAIYLDDIFDLNEFPVAARFIRGAAFGLSHSRLTIKDGSISPEVRAKSPMIRIGGPGLVNAHMENAVLFEKIDGSPDVIGASTRRYKILDGFERFRQVIDLRDQVLEVSVEGRTQDGILVKAKDVKFVFSVYRGEPGPKESSTFPQPYRYVGKAIENLVYRQKKGDPLPLAMKSAVEAEMRDFIGQHKLSEFLANTETGQSDFTSREEMANLFYNFASFFTKNAPERGAQLQWIGVGTWETISDIVPERHLDAWQMNCQARAGRSPKTLNKAKKDSRLKEQLRLVNDLLVTAGHLESTIGAPNEQVFRSLGKIYFDRMVDALRFYEEKGQPPPEALKAVHQYLLRRVQRWL